MSSTKWTVWLSLACIGLGGFDTTPCSATDRPNVIWILADDLSYRDLGFMGNDSVHTPNLDALAARSARYPFGYVPMSVCRPSLATFLTGLYPHQHGIHFNHPPPGLAAMRRMTAKEYHQTRASTDYLIQRVPTLPRVLAQAGYACLQTGKYWEGSYQTAGFTEGMTTGLPALRVSPVTGTRPQDNGELVAHGNGDAGLVIGRETMQPIEDFIARKAGQEPFFIWYAPFMPHAPFDAPANYQNVARLQIESPELLPYYAEIARFDDTVGMLLQMLADRELEEQTLIIFACDNGFRPDAIQREGHNQRSKLSEYEDGLRTPLLICWPKKVQAGEHKQLVHTTDLMPTVLSAVGLSHEITDDMLGRDLMPSATGQRPLEERAVFGAIYPNDAQALEQPARHVRGSWVRAEQYKLIVPGPAPEPLQRQLYNLVLDPGEQRNLIDEPSELETVQRLTQLLDQWWPVTDQY